MILCLFYIVLSTPCSLLYSVMTLLIGSVSQIQSINASQAPVQFSVQKYKQLLALASIHGLNNIDDQYLHQPAKVSSQSQLLRIHMKQISLTGQGCHSFSNHTSLSQVSRTSSGWVCPARKEKNATPWELKPLRLMVAIDMYGKSQLREWIYKITLAHIILTFT